MKIVWHIDLQSLFAASRIFCYVRNAWASSWCTNTHLISKQTTNWTRANTLLSYIHTYITKIIGHYNSSIRIPTSLLLLCMLICSEGRGSYSLMSSPNYRFLRNFSGKFFTYSPGFARNPLWGRNIFSYLVLLSDLWFGTETSCLLSQHTTHKTTVTSLT